MRLQLSFALLCAGLAALTSAATIPRHPAPLPEKTTQEAPTKREPRPPITTIGGLQGEKKREALPPSLAVIEPMED